MGDDWRVEVDVEGHGGLRHLLDGMREHQVARAARGRLAEGVTVTVDEDRLFAYAATEEQAREAERVLGELTAARGLQAQAIVTRWHEEEQRWEPPGEPLPATPDQRDAERRARDARQEAEARERGYAEWEVRIELRDHHMAETLAAHLAAQGLTVVQRSHVVVVSAASEDEADELAERIRKEAPEALRVAAEGSAAVAMDELNPLSVVSGRWRSL
ncbi:MAG: hypothetical protein ACXVFN_07970 [Solirubrobacteraceae bacterium]